MATVDPNTQLTTYDYDANGNMVEKVVDNPSTGIKTTLYTYDAENRLATVDDGSGVGGVVSYTYDADGIRTSKLVGVTLTTYVVDKNRPYAQVLEERLEVGGVSTVVKHYVYGHDLISQTDRPGDGQYPSTSYFHYDGQMSTRALSQGATAIVDPTPAPLGSVIAEYSYDAFGTTLDLEGNPLPAGSTSATDYLYTGEQHDANAGFYYLRARYYSPGVGRFVTRDTYQGSAYDPVSLHRYLYCVANPVNRMDPSGCYFISYATVAVAVVVMAIVGLAWYSFSSSRQRKTAQPRTVTVRISVALDNKPSNWKTDAIEKRLIETMGQCFKHLKPGQAVKITLVEESATGKLGWTERNGLRSHYDARVTFSSRWTPPVSNADGMGNVGIAPNFLRKHVEDYGFTPNWNTRWSNILAHEVFWLSVRKNAVDSLLTGQDIASGRPNGSIPYTFKDESISSIIDAMALSRR